MSSTDTSTVDYFDPFAMAEGIAHVFFWEIVILFCLFLIFIDFFYRLLKK